MAQRPASASSLLVAACALATLAGCGSSPKASPAPPAPAADREWLANARQFVQTLEADLGLSSSGGANLATARRAITNTSDIYTMLVAYTLFGDCRSGLANVGVPSSRTAPIETILGTACRQLQRSAILFQEAMTAHSPKELLAATQSALEAAPTLTKASDALDAARSG